MAVAFAWKQIGEKRLEVACSYWGQRQHEAYDQSKIVEVSS